MRRTAQSIAEALERRTLFDLAPDSLAHLTFDNTVVSGTPPFASEGYYQFQPDVSKPGDYLIIDPEFGSEFGARGGKYAYTKDTANTGQLVFEGDSLGTQTGYLVFDTASTGMMWITDFHGTETSTFVIAGGGDPGTIDLSNGVLSITATSGDDVTTVAPDTSGHDTYVVTQNGQTHEYPRSAVTSIVADLGAGRDTFTGGGNAPILVMGGDGNDSIFGGNVNDTLDGGTGNDTLYGFDGEDRLIGGDGNDAMEGLGGSDRMYCGSGDDIANGGGGVDYIYGGDGNDYLGGGYSNDHIYGENGNDTIGGGFDNDVLDGGANVDVILGNAGNDTLLGGGGNDSLNGEHGLDSLSGGAGNDTLFGNDGQGEADTLNGDGGYDTGHPDQFDTRISLEVVLAS